MKESTAVATVDAATVEVSKAGHGPSGIELFLDKLDAVSRAADALAKGGFYGIRDPNVMGTIILQAMELGVPVGVAAKNIYTFKGNVGMMGALMLGLAVSRCGITVEEVEKTTTAYRGIMRRMGWADMHLHFDEEMAVRSKLLRRKGEELVAYSGKQGDVWDDWRQNMLMWKAINDGLRIMGADYFAMHQVYDYETVQQMAHEDAEEHRLDTSEELRAAGTDPVEPDPDILTDDEIDQLRKEVRAAVGAGVIERSEEDEILKGVEHGLWKSVREAWEEVRLKMLDVEQGALGV